MSDQNYLIEMPRGLTAENGMKAALIGDLSISVTRTDDEGDEYQQQIILTWDDTKRLYNEIVEAWQKHGRLPEVKTK